MSQLDRPVRSSEPQSTGPLPQTRPSIDPVSAERAPYFAAFVANSCSNKAKLVTAEPETALSIPAMVMREFSASLNGATIVRTREWSVFAAARRLEAI